MKNQSGDILKIRIKGYQLKNSFNSLFNSDWLDADLMIKKENRQFNMKLEFMLVEELERIQRWLTGIIKNEVLSKELDFIDPNLKFKLMSRSKMPVIKVIFYLNETEKEVWELFVTNQNMTRFVSEINALLIKFPCRCGYKHELN